MLCGSLVNSAEELSLSLVLQSIWSRALRGNASLAASTCVRLLITLANLHCVLVGMGGKEHGHAGQGLLSDCPQAVEFPALGFPLDPLSPELQVPDSCFRFQR